MVQRQLPRPAEIFELVRFKKPELDAKKRRLEAALTIDDLRAIARRRTPKAAFDYTEGAAEEEISLARARQAFRDIEFRPSILRGAAEVNTSCEIFGGPSALPFGIAPTGFTRLMQTEGEIAGASAAGAAGIPFCLSTLGTTSIEGITSANPAGRNWFQLYVMRDREISYGLTRRAAAAGFDTLLFTVNAPVAGARLRDKRNGFSIPPQLTLGTIASAIPRPRWWIDFLTTPKLEFASLTSTGGTVGELLDAAMDPTISFADLDVIRSLWPGKIVVKGVQMSPTPGSSPISASPASCSPTTAAGSSTAPPCRSACCPRSCARSARTPRSRSTPASCPAPTSSPRSPSARSSP